MALFVAERYAPVDDGGVDRVLRGDRHAANSSGEIRHVRTWLLPDDETCLSLFEAPSADHVRTAGDAVGVTYRRVTAAMEESTV